MKHDVIIIGSGLSGLSAGIELADKGRSVTMLERNSYLGGRCADWDEDGMHVESGLHRWLGFYKELPQLFSRAGLDHADAVIWEDEVQFRLPDGGPQAVVGLSPLHQPVKTFAGWLGNLDWLSAADKASLIPFFTAGLADYELSPEALDNNSVYEYAKKRGVTDEAITNLLIPLTEGIFFLPPDEYSAYVFMGILVPGVKRPYTLRVGAFAGGMTAVMTGPIADGLVRMGGTVTADAPVERLIVEGGRVAGVVVNGERLDADHVVLATGLAPAKSLLREALGEHESFRDMFTLPSMPAVTLQIELDGPALPKDHTVFSPTTIWASYAEQSRSTFRGVAGRLSIDLAQPERFLNMAHEEVLAAALADAKRLGIDIEGRIRQYRVISHAEDFYSLGKGMEKLRPKQATDVPGLTLAGDYTSQPMFCAMEGAVISGLRAARDVLEK